MVEPLPTSLPGFASRRCGVRRGCCRICGPPAWRAARAIRPLAHPVEPAHARLLIVCLGDSITSFGYPALVSARLGKNYRVSNEGFSGETSAQILGRWRFGLQETHPDVLVVLGGVNDLRIGTGFAAPAIANLSELFLEADQAGTRIVAVTVLPFKGDRSWTPSLEREREAINRALLDYRSQHSRTTCLDAAASMSGGPKLLDDLDSGDHLHLSELGNSRLAQLVAEHMSTSLPAGSDHGCPQDLVTASTLSRGPPAGGCPRRAPGLECPPGGRSGSGWRVIGLSPSERPARSDKIC